MLWNNVVCNLRTMTMTTKSKRLLSTMGRGRFGDNVNEMSVIEYKITPRPRVPHAALFSFNSTLPRRSRL